MIVAYASLLLHMGASFRRPLFRCPAAHASLCILPTPLRFEEASLDWKEKLLKEDSR